VRAQKRKTLVGTVHSDKAEKTITVDVQRRFKHAMYGKYVLRTNRFMAHDEQGEARTGDTVEIVETRPLSKNKRWRLIRVLERAPRHDEETGA
jgi:small subunit ribosomal protein S17